ncbi:MAG: oligopeptide transporter, OPT family [Chlamydiota bacterium]
MAFEPFITSDRSIREFTFKAILLGILFGFIFAIGNLYLALKTGSTVSASIPAAVLSMTILRTFFKKSTILENNIVQTIATVGEGLAAGVAFTIPALIFLGDTPSITKIFALSALGGILGILFMIPMRRYIIVEEHETLPFPEGKACAEILKAGESASHKGAILAAWGFITGISFKICSSALFLWEEVPTWIITTFKKTQISIDGTPALLGVGYIIGPRICSFMFAGGALAWWVIIPLISMFGLGNLSVYPSEHPIQNMSANEIWSDYVRYIGAGTVAIGGLISLFRIFPLVFKTFHFGFKEMFSLGKPSKTEVSRTNKDISLAWLILGSIAIILTLWLLPSFSMNFFTILLLTILGFFFVAVTSITVGIVGSTSNPASGMTITTLLLTCLIFVSLGWTEKMYLISALTMSCVVNVAITMASTTSQDLKTGFLLGATPKSQQIAEIIGIIIPALALGSTIYILHKAYTLGSALMPAPQATLMALIAKGVIHGNLPFTLVGIGIILGLIVGMLKVPILPFAIGLYLPLSLSAAMMVGGLVSFWVHRNTQDKEKRENGILISSGFIGGDTCMGVGIALLTVLGILPASKTAYLPLPFSLLMYALLAIALGFFTLRQSKQRS